MDKDFLDDSSREIEEENSGTGFSLWQRLTNPKILLAYVVIIIVSILFLISAYFGMQSNWYKSLKRDGPGALVIDIMWVLVVIISYGATYFIWENKRGMNSDDDLRILMIYLISSILNVAWGVVFFQGQNLRTSSYLVFVVLIYQLWLNFYFFTLSWKSGLLLIPLTLMYIWLLYSTCHLAIINGEIL